MKKKRIIREVIKKNPKNISGSASSLEPDMQ
jgi:hypothetical protein